MKRVLFLLFEVVTFGSVIAFESQAFRSSVQETAPIFVTEKPEGYREWRFISVAHEEANLNSFASILGNDAAIRAYRRRKTSVS